ncbi:DNA-(apurinic or apyrimidinic site) lyase /endonuclease III [Faunimonas pinastri]|uniref:Endonuclease III n=1 Tax=Faunimonas pinastri TaxID=1855383 RepID=A0A1H9PQ28_9HYPH|nr:endonuclease III [Faunimonas pinastri]SER50351.1 DNA-(apurinic or apyrimidinic site) lyase /endonuclease III [Faunimonas pinastri]
MAKITTALSAPDAARTKPAPAAARKPAKRGTRTRLSRPEIELLFTRLHAKNPEPKGELEYVNPFTLLVAVVLSAQATDAGVNKATRRLFEIADTPEKMLALGVEAVTEHIKTIGLFRGKAKNVVELSRLLVEEHGSEVPPDREALEKLPGVGRKTANVVLNIAFGHPTIAVDTHIFRVSNRTGLAPGKDVDAVEQVLERVTPDRFRLHAHHWLILHGRYVCKARKPDCPVCPIADVCRFKEKVQPAGRYSRVPELEAAAMADTLSRLETP